ncbi:hypothetical protein ANCCEY_01605 [Ancylostoma ceylanicum]|uniref:7TM GPCR serpentine receptor class x (Srx) domain-containing protein n=1 Tax=Ancylostoma ceylanicum TaxID=53326 RepID=A0A0D6MCQ3_9BILA|nr:hypothetical protein ANCCEY_01605 [Ancylostoma ceylanicum]
MAAEETGVRPNIIKVSGIGCITNMVVIALIFKTPSLSNAFGYIWSSHLFGGLGVLLINVLWAAPATVLYEFIPFNPFLIVTVLMKNVFHCRRLDNTITNSFIGGRIGQASLFFWFLFVYGQLQIAINRLFAIVFPISYK